MAQLVVKCKTITNETIEHDLCKSCLNCFFGEIEIIKITHYAIKERELTK
jgi:hypothetical protein